MGAGYISIFRDSCKYEIARSLLESYKMAFKAYYIKKNNLHQSAIASFRRSVKIKLDELSGKNLLITLSDIKNNMDNQIFFDKTPEHILKTVESLILIDSTSTIDKIQKKKPPISRVLEKEIIDLMTDLNYLAYLINTNSTISSTTNMIRNLVFDKNKRENMFSQAFEDKEMRKRIKNELDIATKFSHKVPFSIRKNFNAFLSFAKVKYEALSYDLMEDVTISDNVVVPNDIKMKLLKLCKINYKPQMSTIERHESAIKQLNKIILRIKTGPRVRIVNFKTAIYPLSLPIANSEKNDVFDSHISKFFTGLRYQTFLTKNYNDKRLFLSDENAMNAFLANLDDIHFGESKGDVSKPLNELYWSSYMEDKKVKDLDNNLEYIKDNMRFLSDQNEKIKSLFVNDLSEMYLDQYMHDFANNLIIIKKYEALDLETVDPYNAENDLDSRLIENGLIDKTDFFEKFGKVIPLFLRYIKSEAINCRRGQRE
ncbi:hypothetical protein QEN19_001732 [Hanseniaspora menglaensis]